MGQKLGTTTSFKYFGAVVSHNGSKSGVLSRIAQTTASLQSGSQFGEKAVC